MSRIDRGRRVRITYREDDGTGRPIIVVDVSGDDDLLPHEHREDHKTALADLLGVPLDRLPADAEVEVRRNQHGHPHSHDGDEDHGHTHAEETPSDPVPQGA